MSIRARKITLASGTDAGQNYIHITKNSPEMIEATDYFSGCSNDLAVGMNFRVMSGANANPNDHTIQAPWREAWFCVLHSEPGVVIVERDGDWVTREVKISGRLGKDIRADGKVNVKDRISGATLRTGIAPEDADLYIAHHSKEPEPTSAELDIRWNPGRLAHEVMNGDKVVASFNADEGGKEAAEEFVRGGKVAA